MARNITEVRLLNVPLENDYKHTLYFTSVSAQTSYFLGKTKFSGADFSYQRKDKIIRYPKDYDELVGCNYVMYKNSAYSSKWYYAFITKMEYVSDGMTAIHIETDVIQTWLFNYVVKKSFVEREHCNDDTIGLHTVPEGLETGDYTINKKIHNNDITDDKLIIIGCTVDLNIASLPQVVGEKYNGVYSGIKYYVVETATQVNSIIEKLDDGGKADALQFIFTAPRSLIDYSVHSGEYTYPVVDDSSEPVKLNWQENYDPSEDGNSFVFMTDKISKPTKINGYEPKNNKLFTYPYCYLMMSNNSGASAIYKYELFNSDVDANGDKNYCDFRIHAAITPGMSVRMFPRWYNGVDYNHEEGLTLGKFPICSWNSDVYTNWLTQNAVNIGVSTINSAFQIVGGVAMASTGAGALAGAGSITSGALGIASTLGEVYAHSLQPPQAEGNLNSGDVSFANNTLTFTAYQMTIKKEYAKIIDHYFSMFGYKCHLNKTPYTNHRENYWYIKTIDVNIDGDVPMDDMQKIKDCYNNGITFWKNPSNIQDYSVSNEIV